jgi:lysophospholipase L1-like esterase
VRTMSRRTSCPISRSLPLILATVLAALTGCEAPVEEAPAQFELTPATGSMAGYFAVQIHWIDDTPAADAVVAVRFGEIHAYDIQVIDGHTLSAIVQGHPEAGAVDVILVTDETEVTLADAFTYDPPLDPAFESVVAVGASFTQGIQSAVPSDHGTLASPGARLSSQLGAWMPLPQLIPGLFPAMSVDDVGPAPDCETPSVVSYLGWSAVEALNQMMDPETGEFGYQWARVDPDQEVRNLAVGGLRVAEVVNSPADDDFYRQFLAHIVFDPYGGLYDAVPYSPLEIADTLEPTVIVSADLYGNDLITAIVEGNDIDPGEVTSLEDFTVSVTDAVEQMAATGAQVFLTNVPQPSLVPAAAERRRWLVNQGWTTEEEVNEALAEIDAMAADFNDVFDDVCAQHDNVHVVDLVELVEVLKEDGIQVGDETVHIRRFGGLVSLDGLHFSDTGYAVLANEIIEAINTELGTDVPLADLEAIVATDPYAPANLEAAGLDISACTPLD